MNEKTNESKQALCQVCGEPMPPGEEMFNYHGCSGPCPKPPLPPARTVQDAILEAELLMTETFEQLDTDNERDSWFMVRITTSWFALPRFARRLPIGRIEAPPARKEQGEV